MTRKPDFKQLQTALFSGQPEYVPLVELGIAKNIKETFMGRPVNTPGDEIDFALAAGYDYIKIQPVIDFNPAKVGKDKPVKTTKTVNGGDRTWATEHQGIIQEWSDFEKYVWPKIEDISYERFEQIEPILPEGMGVIGQYGDIFTLAWEMMGFENFSMALYTQPDLVEALFEKIGERLISMYRNMVDFKSVGAIWYSDDIAYASGLMISPDALKKYLFPWMKKIGDIAAEKNIPMMYHSDGVLFDVLEDLMDLGVKALHPIEPKAMDIVEVKKRGKGELCVVGNIDLAYTLTRGTPEETAEEVRERIRTVGPGGGYCLGSSNSVPDYVKPENFRAMVETCREFGKYPISL